MATYSIIPQTVYVWDHKKRLFWNQKRHHLSLSCPSGDFPPLFFFFFEQTEKHEGSTVCSPPPHSEADVIQSELSHVQQVLALLRRPQSGLLCLTWTSRANIIVQKHWNTSHHRYIIHFPHLGFHDGAERLWEFAAGEHFCTNVREPLDGSLEVESQVSCSSELLEINKRIIQKIILGYFLFSFCKKNSSSAGEFF